MESTSFVKFSLMSLIWIIVLMSEIHGYKACLQTERTALLELKSFFSSISDAGYHEEILSSWVDDGMSSDCCDDWERVNCNASTRRVMQLSLNRITMLNDTDPSSLYYGALLLNMSLFHPFEELQSLDLSDNQFEGFYESEAYDSNGSLRQLKILNLEYNRFNDSILPYLNTLTSLTTLNLGFNSIKGSRTKQGFANLRYLRVLVLTWNRNLTGASVTRLGSGMCNLKNLSELNLSSNNFEDHLPQCLNKLTHLKILDLSHNQLVGNFPTWLLQNNTGLEVLILQNNSFSGILPRLPNAKYDNLRHLDISNNNFSGKLPENLGIVFQKLISLDMSKNNFEGNIPYSIGEMKELQTLDLSRNNFSGELPRPMVSDCLSLVVLDLSNNNFYGQLFPNYMNLTYLSWLYLDNNHFSGKMTDGLLSSTLLEILDVSNNTLSGDIPHWIGNFSGLWVLLMSENYFEGNIPVELNNLESLELIDISENRLSGSMISPFNLSSVKYLYLHTNAISGLIPIALCRSSTLVILDLRDNKLFGRIPDQINELSHLHVLLLRGNYLQGRIPNQLCQLRKLGIMDLSHNRLNGPIPYCLGNLSFWKEGTVNYSFDHEFPSVYQSFTRDSPVHLYKPLVHLYNELLFKFGQRAGAKFVTKNRYEFFIGSNLELMAGLDLSGNEFGGEIPWEIGQLQNIQTLNLSNNLLSGAIPASFSNLKKIESLDLSRNKLNGRIPPQLTELNFLSNFNVSYNNLSGPIPENAQFATFDEGSYKGNSALCGSMIKRTCSSALTLPAIPYGGEEDEDHSVIDMAALRWSFGASYASVILGLFAALL